MRHRARTDANHKAMVECLHAYGWKTRYVKWPSDYTVMHGNDRSTFTYLEIKADRKPVTLTADQKALISEGWPFVVVRTPFDVVKLSKVGGF
jgi:hypothetical protein